MKRILTLACAIAALSLASSAGAQQPQLEHPKLDAKACADRERLAFGDAAHLLDRETTELDRETTGAGSSDSLGRNDAVICPPQDLDPDIQAPAPGGGRTPIVPPSAVEPPGTQAK
jgi:hypothetical protein